MCSDYSFWADALSKFANAHVVIQALIVLSVPASIGIICDFVKAMFKMRYGDRRVEVVEYRWADDSNPDDKDGEKDWRRKVIPHRRERD